MTNALITFLCSSPLRDRSQSLKVLYAGLFKGNSSELSFRPLALSAPSGLRWRHPTGRAGYVSPGRPVPTAVRWVPPAHYGGDRRPPGRTKDREGSRRPCWPRPSNFIGRRGIGDPREARRDALELFCDGGTPSRVLLLSADQTIPDHRCLGEDRLHFSSPCFAGPATTNGTGRKEPQQG